MGKESVPDSPSLRALPLILRWQRALTHSRFDCMSQDDLTNHTPFMRQNMRMVNNPKRGAGSGAYRPIG